MWICILDCEFERCWSESFLFRTPEMTKKQTTAKDTVPRSESLRLKSKSELPLEPEQPQT